MSKGQVELGAVPTLVITLVVIGIVIAIGAMVLQSMQTSTSFSPTGGGSDNITITTFPAVYNLTVSPILGGSVSYWNNTGAATLTTSNYTIYTNNGTIAFNPTCKDCNATYVYVSYSYATASDASNATAAGIAGITTFADFQSVIAIVLVAAVILGLVGLVAFAGRSV